MFQMTSELVHDIFNFFKTLMPTFSTNRKKRPCSYVDVDIPFKRPRNNMSRFPNSEDDFSNILSFDSIKHRKSMSPKSPLYKFKENVVYNIDDDDDVIEIKPSDKFRQKYRTTSTPNTSHNFLNNGDDDVKVVKVEKSFSQKKNMFDKSGLDYISHLTNIQDTQNEFRRPFSTTSRPSRPSLDSVYKNTQNGSQDFHLRSHYRTPSSSLMLNESFRLDEKDKYQQLLYSLSNNDSNTSNGTPKYRTPVGKVFRHNYDRGAKLVNAALKKNGDLIDLTEDENKKTKPKMSTKDTLLKILALHDEPIDVKDSDSEVEVLPNPPSPKPDIKVDRINSLKTIMDTNESTHNSWLENKIQEYKNKLTEKQQEINGYKLHIDKCSKLNKEIRERQLEESLKRCLHIKETILPEELPDESSLPELSEEQERIISRALNPRGNLNEVLVQAFSLSITRRDIMTLSGLNWLNDEVINFYMNLIIQRGKLPKWPKAYAMNTFFYPKLLKDGPASLRRWTRKVDIFAHDIIAIPIHLGVHWCMSIIDFRQKTIKYYDSMGGSNRRCLDALLNYLQAEHLDKKKTEYDVSDWELECVKDIPQQMNGSDCGMFSCTFAEYLTRDAKITFSQEDMPYLRRKMVLEILTETLLIT